MDYKGVFCKQQKYHVHVDKVSGTMEIHFPSGKVMILRWSLLQGEDGNSQEGLQVLTPGSILGLTLREDGLNEYQLLFEGEYAEWEIG